MALLTPRTVQNGTFGPPKTRILRWTPQKVAKMALLDPPECHFFPGLTLLFSGFGPPKCHFLAIFWPFFDIFQKVPTRVRQDPEPDLGGSLLESVESDTENGP